MFNIVTLYMFRFINISFIVCCLDPEIGENSDNDKGTNTFCLFSCSMSVHRIGNTEEPLLSENGF